MSQTTTVINRALPSRAQRTPGVLIGILADVCVVGLLGLSMWLIVRSGQQPPILYMTFAIVGVRALAIGRAAFRYLERLFSHDAAFAQLKVLRTETFETLIPRVPGVLDSQRRGDMLTGFVDDLDALQDEPLRVRQPLIVTIVVTVMALVVIAIISPLAALITAVCLALACGLAITVSSKVAGETDRELTLARSELADALLERISNAETFAAFGATAQGRARVKDAQDHLAAVQRRSVIATGFTDSVISLGAGIATVLILLWVSPGLGESITPTLFAAAVIVPAAVGEVFVAIPTAVNTRRKVQASAERVATLTETPIPEEIPQTTEHPMDFELLPGTSAVSVENLSIRYPHTDTDVIKNLSFMLNAGELLVVTGPSGIGKSTLAMALVRMLEYQGSYKLFGHEAKTLSINAVREHVGLCEQNPHLFDSDLRQNLKFAHDTATDEELMEVLQQVGLKDWALERDGLDTYLGQRGSLVSGGQAQRIALARALLAEFPVIVLDEPTAGVDRQVADALITDLVGAIDEDRAVILITHTDLPDEVSGQQLRLEDSIQNEH